MYLIKRTYQCYFKGQSEVGFISVAVSGNHDMLIFGSDTIQAATASILRLGTQCVCNKETQS